MKAKAKPTTKRNPEMTGRDFDALSPAEKERIFNEIERGTPEQRRAQSRPLNAAERARWKRVRNKVGRPRIGKGVKTIALSIEQGLLERADAYAGSHGISRAQVVARGLLSILGNDHAKAG
jgi:hypothetical protein